MLTISSYNTAITVIRAVAFGGRLSISICVIYKPWLLVRCIQQTHCLSPRLHKLCHRLTPSLKGEGFINGRLLITGEHVFVEYNFSICLHTRLIWCILQPRVLPQCFLGSNQPKFCAIIMAWCNSTKSLSIFLQWENTWTNHIIMIVNPQLLATYYTHVYNLNTVMSICIYTKCASSCIYNTI